MKDKTAGIMKIVGVAVVIILLALTRFYAPNHDSAGYTAHVQEETEGLEQTEQEKAQKTESLDQTKQVKTQKNSLRFRNDRLLEEHFDKHGRDMGFSSADEYEKAAAAAAVNPRALHKAEKEDGDDVYYVEDTNEFVIVSTDGYIRTYFLPDSGKKYFDKQ